MAEAPTFTDCKLTFDNLRDPNNKKYEKWSILKKELHKNLKVHTIFIALSNSRKHRDAQQGHMRLPTKEDAKKVQEYFELRNAVCNINVSSIGQTAHPQPSLIQNSALFAAGEMSAQPKHVQDQSEKKIQDARGCDWVVEFKGEAFLRENNTHPRSLSAVLREQIGEAPKSIIEVTTGICRVGFATKDQAGRAYNWLKQQQCTGVQEPMPEKREEKLDLPNIAPSQPMVVHSGTSQLASQSGKGKQKEEEPKD